VPEGAFRFESLDQQNRNNFSCGNAALDQYLKERINQDRKKFLATPRVLVDSTTGVVVGYYTLSSTSIDLSALPPERAKPIRGYDSVPCILLGRFAIDQRFQGRGLGQRLLLDALARSLQSSEVVAAWAVVLDAKDDNARAFYEKFGFFRILDDEYRLFLPMATIKKLNLPGAGGERADPSPPRLGRVSRKQELR
jgi:GNAT superfamily N-acetyltransferase